MNDPSSWHQPGFSLLETYPVTLGDSSHGLRKDGTQHKAEGSGSVFPLATNLTLSERSDTVKGKSDHKRGNMRSRFAAGPLLIALILMLTLACSGDKTPAAPETDRAQQELLHTIERMDKEMEALRQEMVESKRAKQDDRPDTGKVQATQDPERTSTTEPATTPTSEQEPTAEAGRQDLQGICYRTPELQEVILETLDVDLCQVVNTHELYRIRTLSVNTPSVKEGDFEGLVNVGSLGLSTGLIEANGLRGLTGLKELSLSVQVMDRLLTESFSGLKSIKELEISARSNEHIGGHLPELPELPNLKHLKIYKMRPTVPGEGATSPFRNLGNLETLDLTLVFGHEATGTRTEPYQIPATLLKGSRKLKEIQIETWVMPNGHEIQLPEDIFKENPALERVEIRYPRTFIERQTFRHLDNLKELKVINRTSWDPVKYPELVISKKSPLYESIKSGETKPSRYLTMEAADD